MPGYIAVFAIFEADAAAIEIGYVIGVAAVSVGNESVGTWQVEDTQRLAYYLINDVVITSVKAGSVEAGKTLVFGGGNQFAIVHTAQRKQLVLLEGDVGIDVQFHVLSLQRGDADGYLQTAVAHGADIRQQGVVGKGRYAYVVEVEHIRRFGVVIIGGEQQAVAEHGKVNTCIEGMFHFPFQVGIRVSQVSQ